MKSIDKLQSRPTGSAGVPPALVIPAQERVKCALLIVPDNNQTDVRDSRLYVNSGCKSGHIDNPAYTGWVNTGQSGAALITSLIFLTFLTILGMSTLGTAMLESRMAGNSRDRNLAFQAAEMGLRDAERYIRDSGRIVGVNEHGYDIDGSCTPTSEDCDAQLCKHGLCYNGGTMAAGSNAANAWYRLNKAVWDDAADKWKNALQYAHTNSVVGTTNGVKIVGINRAATIDVLDSETGNCGLIPGSCLYSQPAALPLVRRQPEYLIEAFEKTTGGQRYYYRITARGYGMRTGTRVMLQEIYTP